MNPFQMGGNPFGQGGASGAPVTGVGGSTQAAVGGSTGTTPVGQGGAAPIGQGGAPPAGVGGTGPATPGAIPIGTGTVITPDAMGWVAGAMNQWGIQGSFYTFADSTGGGTGTSTIAMTPDFTGGRVCVSGSGAAIPIDPVLMAPTPEAYGQYWGAGVGFNLADPGTMTGPGPWQRGTVTGFSFTITGTQIPPALQFRFKASPIEGGAANTNYCANGVAMGANEFHFREILLNCYDAMSLTSIAATAPLQDIQWQIATVAGAPTPFNFCIENLTPITTP